MKIPPLNELQKKSNLQLPCYVHLHCATFANFCLHDKEETWLDHFETVETGTWAHDINVKWSGQNTPLFLMSDVLPVNAMVTTEDETGEINTGIQLWQEVVSGGSDTVFLLMSRHCICWKHLLCAVKSSRFFAAFKSTDSPRPGFILLLHPFVKTWTHKRASAQRFLQLSQKWPLWEWR